MAFNPHEYLNTFNNFESQLHKLRPEDFNLSRIQKFLDLAGNPDMGLKVIHVAGTKGKGSTCAFMARVLQEAGYKVGLYTSPHLHKRNERIRVLDKSNLSSQDNFAGSISDEELGVVLTKLRPYAAAIQNDGGFLTFFEVLTVAAICHFAKACVDIVILETGLGGRLDATNAVDSLIAVISPVSLDHIRILGSTLSKIASEKAAIIKNSHQRAVIAPQEKEAMDVILNRCKEFGVHPTLVSPESISNLKIGLKGRHQRVNAATAVEAIRLLKTMGFNISDQAINDGLDHVRWPGRFELLHQHPDLIVDGAHNGASAKALGQTLIEEYPQQRVILVLGISDDKDIAGICAHLKQNAAHIILTQTRHPRAHTFTQEEAGNYFAAKPFEIVKDVQDALERALKIAGPEDVILVTGSIFIAAEAAEYLAGQKG